MLLPPPAPAAGAKGAAAGAAAPAAAGGKGAAKGAGGKGAKGGKGDKGAGGAAKGPSAPTLPPISSTTDNLIRGVNVLKGKQDPPLLPDSEYPPWLWQFVTEKDGKMEALLQASEKKLQETEQARQQAVGQLVDLKGLLDMRKKLRRDHKKVIKDQNFLKAKK